MPATGARARRPGAAETSPILAHADVQRMLLTMKAFTQAARGICYLTAAALDAAEGPEGAGGSRPRLPADPRRQGLLHRHRQRGDLAGRPGPWRHGLRRGDRRRPAHARRPHPRHLRGHQRHPGHRPRRAQAAAERRRHGAGTDRQPAPDRRGLPQGSRPGLRQHRRPAARRDREPRPGDELPAQGPGLEPARGGAGRARRPTCACSASSRAAPASAARRSPPTPP